jgi:hypothetical protein
MQLNSSGATTSVRARLRAAACILLAAGAPVVAHAETATPSWQFDVTGLAYAEKARTTIFEPVARITRMFPDGQSFSAQVTLDAMSGASPSGAQPSGKLVTTTSASGVTQTSAASEVPTKPFHDFRGAYALDWVRPIGFLTLSAGGNLSRERDYQSVGWHGQGSLDLDHHLTTLSAGGGVNRDQIFPMGGTPAGMELATTHRILTMAHEHKTVTEGMLGLSRVLTRRWLFGLNGSRLHEDGYLTEPYKIVSVLSTVPGADTLGVPVTDADLTENLPTKRNRSDVLASSVYHFESDVLYASYRYYWDDWGVKSHTVDLKYRIDLPQTDWLQPHVRFYTQTPADFFVFGLRQGSPLPKYATSDLRLGPLRSLTLGLGYGCPVPNSPGEFTVRGEYMRQWGDGHPATALGVQRSLDLFPSLDTFTLVAGYSVQF